MLVLTRKTQERILIGDNITISILKLKGNTVRIGIEAPRDVRVLRGELPTFDGTLEIEAGAASASETATSKAATSKTTVSKSAASKTAPAKSSAEQSEEEATVSELEWEVLKRIASRRKPCLSVRRCAPKENAAAPLSPVMRGTSLAASPVAVSE